MHIRPLQREDKEHIRTVLVETGVFRPEEVDVAIELVDVVLDQPAQTDYDMYSCIDDDMGFMGYLCIGPTPMTKRTFDLYWIAVKPAAQRLGVGKQLVEFAEHAVRSKGGKLIVAETSSQPKYLKARTFYLHNGFIEVAHIKDYYDVDDDLVIYGKYIR
jgi:ribosomal protein S18 acetylase RimI-like enzyme